MHKDRYGILNFLIGLLYSEGQVHIAKQRCVPKAPMITDRFCARK
jgi:hypothetical protein